MAQGLMEVKPSLPRADRVVLFLLLGMGFHYQDLVSTVSGSDNLTADMC